MPVLLFLCPCLSLKNGIVISFGTSLDFVGELNFSDAIRPKLTKQFNSNGKGGLFIDVFQDHRELPFMYV